MWPELAKFRHRGQRLTISDKILRVYLVFGNILNFFGKNLCLKGNFHCCKWQNWSHYPLVSIRLSGNHKPFLTKKCCPSKITFQTKFVRPSESFILNSSFSWGSSSLVGPHDVGQNQFDQEWKVAQFLYNTCHKSCHKRFPHKLACFIPS